MIWWEGYGRVWREGGVWEWEWEGMFGKGRYCDTVGRVMGGFGERNVCGKGKGYERVWREGVCGKGKGYERVWIEGVREKGSGERSVCGRGETRI
jgi:hypothetical protein